ncbi:MAG: hypothetical protein JSU65_13735 [Candidatus Zixiibacteriota bacterium]|nr:MAG: hypothetical protein JSU65_13735 [candidate division Zixibacteria bacterium]
MIERKFAAVLLSRQSLRPTSSTKWVSQAVKAVSWVKDQKMGLCSSVGMQTWDMVTALGSIEGVPMRLYLPVPAMEVYSDACRRIIHDFELNPDEIELHPVLPTSSEAEPKSLPMLRDKAVVESSDLIIPVSVRSNGHMARLLAECSSKTTSDFLISHVHRSEPLGYDLVGSRLNPDLKSITGDYVVHWTRGTNESWPGERPVDLYRDIFASASWPRSAHETLRRILRTGRIMASARHMPGKVKTVSFSALLPHEVVPLIRWRARYQEMSFEPYGIGIERQYAVSRGIKPVRYYSAARESLPSDVPGWLTQSMGSITDWRCEKEYRHEGDFVLGNIPLGKMILFCRFPEEAEALETEFRIRAVSFL